MIGIYEIYNTRSKKTYIGSSKDIELRFRQHRRKLLNGDHDNIHLQRSYNKHGIDAFTFHVITKCDVSELLTLEQFLIDEDSPEYNIGSVGGGDNTSNHPNNAAIRLKISEASKKNWTEARKLEWSDRVTGEGNPNWKDGMKGKKLCPVCNQTLVAKISDSCFGCRDIKGSNNPFFGRKHSEETKAKLSAANRGKIPTNARILICEGVEYVSLAAASRAYEVTSGAMHYRVNSKARKWEEFYYKSLTTIETD